MKVNVVFILKSLYKGCPMFKKAQDACRWKLLPVAVLKYTVHTRMKTRSYMTDIFNLLCLVGTILLPVLATDSEINITFKNMDLTT